MRQTRYPWPWRYSLRATHERARFADLAGQRVTFAETVFSDPDTWTARQSDTRRYGPTWFPRKVIGNAGTEPENACQDHGEVTPFANPLSDH
jgi:hypothetical protein